MAASGAAPAICRLHPDVHPAYWCNLSGGTAEGRTGSAELRGCRVPPLDDDARWTSAPALKGTVIRRLADDWYAVLFAPANCPVQIAS